MAENHRVARKKTGRNPAGSQEMAENSQLPGSKQGGTQQVARKWWIIHSYQEVNREKPSR
jgi:hypothetical protein